MKARVFFGAVCLLAIVGPAFAPHGLAEPLDMPYAPVSGHAWLGTDYLGADVFSRVLMGGRALILVATLVLLVTYLVGIPAGLLAGYRGGWIDSLIMRLADVLMAMPAFVLLAVIVTGVGRGIGGAAVAITVVLLPDTARIVRAATIQALAHDYVEVAMARGERTRVILFREVLPNLGLTLAADAGVRFLFAIIGLAVASFLGLGVQPPSADWALMVFENQGGLALQPLAVLAPSVMLLALLLSASLFADSLAGQTRRQTKRQTKHPTNQTEALIPRQRTAGSGPAPAKTPALARAVELSVAADATGVAILDRVDLTVQPGQITAIVGESGSGKTTLVLALLGHVREGMSATAGETWLRDQALLSMVSGDLRRLRLEAAAYVPQDPRTALAAHLRIRDQIGEVLRARGVPKAARQGRVEAVLGRVNLPSDQGFLARRPHQLSGGQLQRVAIAVALAHSPSLLVLDEPTSALDPVNTAMMLADVAKLCRDDGTAVVLVSHDLGAVGSVADHVAVMHRGRVVEEGPAQRILNDPRHDHTRALVEANSATPAETGETGETAETVLEVRDLAVELPGVGRLIDGLEVSVPAGGCVCVVGPSGSGKTTLLRAIAGLVEPVHGQVVLSGVELNRAVRQRELEQLRRVQLVPQNPYDSLNPRHTVTQIVGRPATQFRRTTDVSTLVGQLLTRVELDPTYAMRRPAALSGGERQRVALARALAAQPDVLLCDEVTSALDSTVAAAVLNLLDSLRRDLGVALIVVTHDPGVVRRLGGQVLEFGPRIREFA